MSRGTQHPDMRTDRARGRVGLAVAGLLVAATGVAHGHPRFVSAFLSYPAPFNLSSIGTADLDGDGHPDVVMSMDGKVVVRLGAGDGTLGAEATYPGGSGQFAALGDLDGDGANDLVTQGDSIAISVWLGNGDGSFAAPVKFRCGRDPLMAVIARLDDDDALDIATANGSGGSVSVFLGHGDGSFAPRVDVHVDGAPRSLALGDFDGDGDPDLAVAKYQSSTVTPLLGDGLGGFVAGTPFPTISDPYDVGSADLNGDALADLVLVSPYGRVMGSHLALGGGAFGGPVAQALPDTPTGLRISDLDNDGRPDAVTAAYYLSGIFTMRGQGDGTFEAPRLFSCPRIPRSFDIADLNGGGKPDVVVVVPGTLAVLPGNGDVTLGGLVEHAVGAFPVALAAADLDEDGHSDVVTANAEDHTVSILLGDGEGGFAPRTDFPVGTAPWGVAIADVDADGDLDLAIPNSGPGTQAGSTVSVLLGDGGGGFAPPTEFAVGRWPRSIAVADLNGDTKPDIAVGDYDSGPTLTVLYGTGDGSFGGRQDFTLGSHPGGVVIADATDDGQPDIVLAGAGSSSGAVSILPGHGNGTWDAPIQLEVAGYASSVAVVDLGSDGIADVVAAGLAVFVFTGLGGGSFAPLADNPARGGALAVGDFDEAPPLDVATATGWSSNSVSVLYGVSGGGFTGPVDFGAGDRPVSIATTDLDGDGRADLVTANAESGTVSVMMNSGNLPWSRWLEVPTAPAAGEAAIRVRPNPAGGDLTVEFSLARAGPVRIRVFDIAGRVVAELSRGHFEAGTHAVAWSRRARDAAGMASGVCFVELRTGRDRVVRRAVLVR